MRFEEKLLEPPADPKQETVAIPDRFADLVEAAVQPDAPSSTTVVAEESDPVELESALPVWDPDATEEAPPMKVEAPPLDSRESSFADVILDAVDMQAERDQRTAMVTGLADDAILHRARRETLFGLMGMVLLVSMVLWFCWLFVSSLAMVHGGGRPVPVFRQNLKQTPAAR